jgi:hypothetical protein
MSLSGDQRGMCDRRSLLRARRNKKLWWVILSILQKPVRPAIKQRQQRRLCNKLSMPVYLDRRDRRTIET